MTLANPRWLIDGMPATNYGYGRTVELAVDVRDFTGGEIVFKLQKTAPAPPLQTKAVVVSPVGPTPTTVTVPVPLTYQWQVLESLPTTYSYYNECCDAGTTLPYRTGAWFLADPVSDDVLFPPLVFTATAAGQPAVTAPVIRRRLPEFVPGNKIELLVDGDEIQASVLAAIAAATDHVHLNWFFFDVKSKIANALIAAAQRGVEVRLLLDIPATAMPEPLGQGIKPGDFQSGLAALEEAGVEVATSGLLVAPLDNLREIKEPEYRERLEVQREYVKRLALTHGGLIGFTAFRNYTDARLSGRLPRLIRETVKSIRDFGSAGIGSPVLLGGCRDHTKMVVVDGRVAFCGGANAQHYYIYDNPIDPAKDATDEMNQAGNTEKWLKWHDCFARYEGPAVHGAQRYFIERWAVSTGQYLSTTLQAFFPPTPNLGPASIKVINNVPGLERDIEAEYLRLFRNSTQRILVENPYVTDDLLAMYLAHAAQIRHLPVDLIVPEKYLDFGIARDLMKARWDALRAAGIALYAYNTHMLHVKVATADGTRSIVSSFNFAKSSSAQLFEHGIVVDDAAFATEIEQKLFAVDRPVSTRVTTSTAPDWNKVKETPMRLLDRIV